MVVRDGVHAVEVVEVVLVGRVVAVPRHHVERRVGQRRLEQVPAELVDDPEVGGLAVLEGRHGVQEVARVGQAVGTCAQDDMT